MQVLLNEKQAAKRLGMAVRTLQRWRFESQGPAYIKVGGGRRGNIRYRPEDLDAFCVRVDPSDDCEA